MYGVWTKILYQIFATHFSIKTLQISCFNASNDKQYNFRSTLGGRFYTAFIRKWNAKIKVECENFLLLACMRVRDSNTLNLFSNQFPTLGDEMHLQA